MNNPMGEFLSDLTRYPFLQHALIAGVLAGVACGIVGSYVVTKKISTIAGSIAHTVLGGLGAARYFQVVHRWDWCTPLWGAIAAALLGSELALEGGEGELAARAAMGARGMAIAGGTSEVTRNQIAERILGMPRDPLIK